MLQINPSSDGHRLQIAGEMTIYHAAELREALLAHVPASGSLALDLSAVDEIDSSGVQLLLAFERSARVCGAGLHLAAPSDAVAAALRELGLAAQFAIPCQE